MVTNPNNALIDPPCGTIVYRLILKKAWVDPDNDSKIKAEAFMRRRPKLLESGKIDPMDSDGLSVFDSYRIDGQACIETSRSCFGLATLHVGTLLDHGLTVIRDPEDYRKILITNIPFENPADADQEHLLDTIAESARIAVRCKHKKPN
jgi:hypothetical protein